MDQYEGPGEIQADNSTLAEATSVSIDTNGNNNQVTTMKKGLAGRSKGAVVVQIQVENAIPKGGMEHEYIEKVQEGADISIAVELAGKRYVYDGYIDSTSTNQGTDQAASISFTVISGPATIL